MFSGGGAVMLQIMMWAFGGWIGATVARGLGKGQAASMIETATTFVCIGQVVNVVAKAIRTASQVM